MSSSLSSSAFTLAIMPKYKMCVCVSALECCVKPKSFSNNVNIQSVHVFTSQLHIGNGLQKKKLDEYKWRHYYDDDDDYP